MSDMDGITPNGMEYKVIRAIAHIAKFKKVVLVAYAPPHREEAIRYALNFTRGMKGVSFDRIKKLIKFKADNQDLTLEIITRSQHHINIERGRYRGIRKMKVLYV